MTSISTIYLNFEETPERPLKGQCHEIFNHFFGLKDSTWATYEQAKTVLRTFLFLGKTCVCVVNDYVDMC